MAVGIVRSLQPTENLLVHCNTKWRVYNSIAKTSKGDSFFPLLMFMSEAFSSLAR